MNFAFISINLVQFNPSWMYNSSDERIFHGDHMPSEDFQYVAITSDFCSGILSSRVQENYDLVYEGVQIIDREIRKAFSREGIRFTFFIRADNQVKANFDRINALFYRYRPFWLKVQQEGDEIGWHPHLYRLRGNLWMPQTDGPGVERQLKNCFVELPMDEFYIASARIGEGMMTNYAINTLDKIGIKADSTALPGRMRNDEERRFNWLKAPVHPYHPSRFDYASPGMPGGNLTLLEVPFTMVTTMAPYDKEPLKRYLDLSIDPTILGPGLKEALRSTPFTVAVIHPSFLLGETSDHELLSPGSDAVKQNIANLLAAINMIRRKPKFIRIRDIYDMFEQK